MKRIDAKFYFETPYLNKQLIPDALQKINIHEGDPLPKESIATVILEINYKLNTYSVYPYTTNNKHFLFINESDNSSMWLAVLESIKKAIEFAQTELESQLDKNDWDNSEALSYSKDGK